jgi:peptidyl-prolyl cis-trans isomerase D
MFDAVRNNKKIVQGFLALITLPFALWGVDSYVRNAGSGNDVATVGDTKISVQELQASLREQEDRLRQQFGRAIDPAMFDTPAMRRAVVDSLVSQRLLVLKANESKLTLTDMDLARLIATAPVLQEGGKFSPERYAAFVASQGLSKEAFEQRFRHSQAIQQLTQPVGDAVVAGMVPARTWAAAQLEQREVAEARFLPEAYLSKVAIADDKVGSFYESNRSQFEIAEQVRVDYVVLSKEALQSQVSVSEDEIRKRYESKPELYKQAESRRASHILILAAKDAPEADVKAAQGKADDVLAKVRKAPGDFAKLAKEFSQDPGSADKGGDLSWFGRGAMVKPFEDSVFGMKDGETSGVVRSDFGFHIIRVTGIKPERTTPLAEVKPQIQAELANELGQRKFAEAVEAFGNMVYEQSDSLQPAAEKFKLKIQSSAWLAKGAKAPAPFDNAKLTGALFSEDAVKHKRNTEAVEVAPGLLVSARVSEHKPAALQPIETVRDSIKKRLQTEQAAKLALKEGEEVLAKLAKGEEQKLAWSAPRSHQRATANAKDGLSADAARAIFKADAGKLPAYAGAALPGGGFAVYRVSAVKAAAAEDPRLAALNQQYTRTVAEEEFTAWLDTLRQRYPVKIDTASLEKKAQ